MQLVLKQRLIVNLDHIHHTHAILRHTKKDALYNKPLCAMPSPTNITKPTANLDKKT